MKFFISADLEGTNGVVSPGEIIPGEPGYEAARILMTEEVNAAVRGLFDAGADEVLVCDSHEVAQNIRVDFLDERAFLLRGDCRPDSMVHSIDSSYDGLLLLGHHAMFGTQNAVLDHTYDQYLIREMKVNDTAYGEVGINALYAAEQGVPFIMASGKEELRHLGKELRYNKKFPKGANVNFYEITGRDTLTELTYERGVEDFTMACGTGTGSVAAVLTEKNLVSGNDVHVSVPGGELFITIKKDFKSGRMKDIFLTGPTNIVAEGVVTDEDLLL